MLKLLKNEYVDVPLFVDLYLKNDDYLAKEVEKYIKNHRLYTRTEAIFIILLAKGKSSDLFALFSNTIQTRKSTRFLGMIQIL